MELHFHINLNRPRWTQHWSRRRKLVLGSALALLLIPSLIVLAHHLPFTDIPTSGALHDAVGAVYGARITAGTTATTYSPNDPVTRGAMAFFMHRGLGRAAYKATPAFLTLTTTEQDLAVLTLDTGGTAGGTGFVKLDAAFTAFNSDSAGCPCEVSFHVHQDTVGSSQIHYLTIYNSPGSTDSSASGAVSWVVSVPTATTRTFRLRAERTNSDGTGALVRGFGTLSAIYVPFGATGGGTLALEPGDKQEVPGEKGLDVQMGKRTK